MSSAYIEMLPPDRPIHMIGQPIIKLVADGGPGGDLGDLGRRRKRRAFVQPYAAPYAYPYAVAAPAVVDVTGSMVTPGDIKSARSAQDMGEPWQGGPEKGTWNHLGEPWQGGPEKGTWNHLSDADKTSRLAARLRANRKAPGLLERFASGFSRFFGGPMGQYNQALQAELTRVSEGGAPDVSAEYFRPKEIPGLPSESEGPHTSREGVYPKKLRDMVVYDMSGSTFVSPAALAGLGCCGSDSMGDYGTMGNFGLPLGQLDRGSSQSFTPPWPNAVQVNDFIRGRGVDAGGLSQIDRGSSQSFTPPWPNAVRVSDFIRGRGVDAGGAIAGMGQFISPDQIRVTDKVRQHGVDAGAALGQLKPEIEAKLLQGRCDGIEKRAKDIVESVVKANADTALSKDQKIAVALGARKALHTLKADWKACRSRVKAIVGYFKKSGNLEKFGLADVDAKINQDEKLAKCKAKLTSIREIACKQRKSK